MLLHSFAPVGVRFYDLATNYYKPFQNSFLIIAGPASLAVVFLKVSLLGTIQSVHKYFMDFIVQTFCQQGPKKKVEADSLANIPSILKLEIDFGLSCSTAWLCVNFNW